MIKPVFPGILDYSNPFTQGLIGSWAFSEGAGDKTLNSSGNGNQGAIASGVFWIGGDTGHALDYDGSGAVDLGGFTDLDGATSFSLFIRLKPRVLPFTAYRGVFARGSGSQRTPWVYGLSGGSALQIHFETTVGGSGDCILNTDTIPLAWFNLGVTWDGTTVKSYIDGVLGAASDTTTGNILANTDGNGFIGDIPGFNKWNGQIDSLYIWKNRTLSEDEIFQLQFNHYQMLRSPTLTSRFFVEEAAGEVPFIVPPSSSTLKPAFPGTLDYSDSLTKNLALAVPLNEGAGLTARDSVKGLIGAFKNSQVDWGLTLDGFVADTPGDDENIYFQNTGIRQDEDRWTCVIRFLQRTRNPNTQSADSTILQFEEGSGTGKKIMFINDHGGAANFKLSTNITTTAQRSVVIALDTVYTAALRKNLTSFDWFVNGQFEGNFSGTPVANDSEGMRMLSTKGGDGNGCFDGLAYFFYWWKRALSDIEIFQLSFNPYQMFYWPKILQKLGIPGVPFPIINSGLNAGRGYDLQGGIG